MADTELKQSVWTEVLLPIISAKINLLKTIIETWFAKKGGSIWATILGFLVFPGLGGILGTVGTCIITYLSKFCTKEVMELIVNYVQNCKNIKCSKCGSIFKVDVNLEESDENSICSNCLKNK